MEKKTLIVNFRVTKKDKELMVQLAESKRMSLSNYILTQALKNE